MSPHCADELKYGVLAEIVAVYQGLADRGETILGRRIKDVLTVNGIRVTLEDGSWLLVRASSNKPELVVVVESTRSTGDMRDLFHKEVKPRLTAWPAIGGYNQEV
jgi:phosphomannomutase/phosphoglucomutase